MSSHFIRNFKWLKASPNLSINWRNSFPTTAMINYACQMVTVHYLCTYFGLWVQGGQEYKREERPTWKVWNQIEVTMNGMYGINELMNSFEWDFLSIPVNQVSTKWQLGAVLGKSSLDSLPVEMLTSRSENLVNLYRIGTWNVQSLKGKEQELIWRDKEIWS